MLMLGQDALAKVLRVVLAVSDFWMIVDTSFGCHRGRLQTELYASDHTTKGT